jgi:hypothetical protein
MLWSFFAEEFSQTAENIRRTVSGAVQASKSALAAGQSGVKGDCRRPSMLGASEVANTISTDESKEKTRASLKFKMVRKCLWFILKEEAPNHEWCPLVLVTICSREREVKRRSMTMYLKKSGG